MLLALVEDGADIDKPHVLKRERRLPVAGWALAAQGPGRKQLGDLLGPPGRRLLALRLLLDGLGRLLEESGVLLAGLPAAEGLAAGVLEQLDVPLHERPREAAGGCPGPVVPRR